MRSTWIGIGLDWIGLGLDWIGLDRLDWIGVDRIGKLVHLTKAVLETFGF